MMRVEMIEGEEYLWLDDALEVWAAVVGLDLEELADAAVDVDCIAGAIAGADDGPGDEGPIAESAWRALLRFRRAKDPTSRLHREGDGELAELRYATGAAIVAGGREDLLQWWKTLYTVAGLDQRERAAHARALAPRRFDPGCGHPRLDPRPGGRPSEWEDIVSGGSRLGIGGFGLWTRWARGPRNDVIVSRSGVEQLAAGLREGLEPEAPAPLQKTAVKFREGWETEAARRLDEARADDGLDVGHGEDLSADGLWGVLWDRYGDEYGDGDADEHPSDGTRVSVWTGKKKTKVAWGTFENFAVKYRARVEASRVTRSMAC